MRAVTTIPHPHLKITIFLYNEKYLIEMEAAQYKQIYKISAESVEGVEAVKQLCTEKLIKSSMDRFMAMHKDFAEAFASLGQG